MHFHYSNIRADQTVNTSLGGITRVSYTEFQPNRSRNMESMNRNSHTALNEECRSLSQSARKSRLPVNIWYKTTPNCMKIRQTVRLWYLVTGGRSNNAVCIQCFICLLHKGPVKSESSLASTCCGNTPLTLQQLSNLKVNAVLQTIDRAQPRSGAHLFYGRLIDSEFR
jgi:hypothetical protein